MEARPVAVPWRAVDGRAAARGLAVAVARTALLAAKAAFALAFVHTSIAPIWPPSGIALAAVLLFGRRAVPGVLLGAFLFNASTPVPLWVAAAMGIGNTTEAVAGAFMLRAAGFRREIDRVRDVLALACLGALVSTAISASVGVGSLLLSCILPDSQVRVGWAIWWFGDAAGMLTVAPLLLLASTRRHWRRPAPGQVLEAAALAATLIVIVQAGLTERVTRPFLRAGRGAAGAGLHGAVRHRRADGHRRRAAGDRPRSGRDARRPAGRRPRRQRRRALRRRGHPLLRPIVLTGPLD
jgi:integral membrane sensor domain MASE1